MMHSKNFVAAIKVGGKILRESSDRVELPFGSEYSVLLKNLDTVRMQAKISIDGEEATRWLIVNPGQSLEVERFVKENLDKGNRFKFIERTEAIENHRGIKIDDGLIRVEFKREKVYEAPKVVEHHTYHHTYHHNYYDWDYPWNWPYYPPRFPQKPWITYQGQLNTTINANNVTSTGNLLRCAQSGQQSQAFNCSVQNMQASEQSLNEAGITVPGSVSEQKFHLVSDFETEKSEVIVLHLIGRKGLLPIQVVKTIQTKLVCETCGKKNKSLAKFCSQCGTSLEKI